jgi:toxin HigB-1
MIVGFRHKGLKAFFEKGDSRKLPPDQVARIRTMLFALNEAMSLEDLDLLTYRLHPLRGELKGFHSMTVRANWRIIFKFADGKAYDLDYLDYH